ncbi:MAG: AAA domain-containing protein, partial [Candidatus Omnitrophota bacterium]
DFERDEGIYGALRRAEDGEYEQGFQALLSLSTKASHVLQRLRAAKDCYRKDVQEMPNFGTAALEVSEASALNPDDQNLSSLFDWLDELDNAETSYCQGYTDQACVQAQKVVQALAELPQRPAYLEDAYSAAQDLSRKVARQLVAEKRRIEDPDDAKTILEGVVSEFPYASEWSQLTLVDIEETIARRTRLLEEAREAYNAGKFNQAKSLAVEAYSLGRAVAHVGSSITTLFDDVCEFARAQNQQSAWQAAYEGARDIVAMEPPERLCRTMDIIGKRAWAGMQYVSLVPVNNIISAVWQATENRKKRLSEDYSTKAQEAGWRSDAQNALNPMYFYQRCEFAAEGASSDTFSIHGLAYRREAESEDAHAQKVPLVGFDIARIGDTFAFWTFGTEGRQYARVSEEYFNVVEVTRDSIVFRCESKEEYDEAQKSIKTHPGFIQRADDVALRRQKERMGELMERLSASLGTEHPTSGTYPFSDISFTDSLLGIQRTHPHKASDIPGGYKMLDPRIAADVAQCAACAQAMSLLNPVTLIQGPPGTGKTSVSAEIANYYRSIAKRVLIVSPSHAGIDNLGMVFLKHGVPFVRVGSRGDKVSTKKITTPNGSVLTVSDIWTERKSILRDLCAGYQKEAKGFIVMGTNNGFLNDAHLARRLGVEEWFSAFDVVIIDEAARATVAETLVPIALARQKLVLVGDHKQLPATGFKEDSVALVKEEVELGLRLTGMPEVREIFRRDHLNGYRISLMYRAFSMAEKNEAEMDVHTLLVNRRTVPFLVEVVNLFYRDQEGKPILLTRDWNNPQKEQRTKYTFKLFDVKGVQAPAGTSFYNPVEIEVCWREIEEILNRRSGSAYLYDPEHITFISPYLAQVEEAYIALRARTLLDMIEDRKLPKTGLSSQDRAVLQAALRVPLSQMPRDQNRRFLENFINQPAAGSVERFLQYLKYDLR